MHEAELLWSAPGHAIARWGDVFVQVRSGEMSLTALESIEMAAHLIKAKHQHLARRGGLLVLTADAPPSGGEVRRRQTEQVRRLTDDERLYLSIVLEGEGIYQMVTRTFVRGVFRTNRRRIFGDVRDGASWLLTAIEDPAPASELVAYVGFLRDKAGVNRPAS